ncbi:MAG: preprotein translocase subunit SecA [Patescibacteria group bacterium]|nr:preprotein translocase subunit SecA [Patescibacteria group bacterium]
MSFLDKIFGDANEKYLKKLQPFVEKINQLEKEFESFSDENLKLKTGEFKEKLKNGETLEDVLPESFALAREASKRTLGQRPYDSQLIGGIVLAQGKIAEMKTGEGKTLAAVMPMYLNALIGQGCHLVTVNDYLARRDAVWMGQIYYALGLSIGCLNHEQSFLYNPNYKKLEEEKEKMRDELGAFYIVEDFLEPCSRKDAYLADVTYGTNNEFGFDYLRDNMAYNLNQKSQRGFNFCIVDEIDSILIDEARTPLIISAPDQEGSKWYQEFARIIPQIDKEGDYEIDEKMKSVSLTEKGVEKIEKILGLENIYEDKGIKYLHYLEQALRAQAINPSTGRPFFAKDYEYVVKDNKVIIVDEFTGRLMPGRRWSKGLHQAVEAKEGVPVKEESLTLASITFQNYFRLYKKLAGMTGTAVTSAEEFDKVYKLDVIVIPTNKPLVRKSLPDRVYKNEPGKLKALVKEIKERNDLGQPLLIGTRSVEKNEEISQLLKLEGVKHQVLNAKNHQTEGETIAQAGKLKAVTVATNMAGRGVDIILGGNPSSPEEAQKVKELGGLHVIGTERHEARRIDDQLRGRTGRQGDSGSSQFFLSLEDDLMRIFGGDRVQSLMSALNLPDDEPIEANLISRMVESAQSKIEGFNFDSRQRLLEYDDVLNKHREVIYKKRREVLEKYQDMDFKNQILEMIEKAGYTQDDYKRKQQEVGENNMPQIQKEIVLKVIDTLWIEHLENMDHLIGSVRLRAYGNLDPLVEYKKEGHGMFRKLLEAIDEYVANTIMKITIRKQPSKNVFPATVLSSGNPVNSQKTKRNEPCPCGAKHPDGRPIKYKHCHGK